MGRTTWMAVSPRYIATHSEERSERTTTPMTLMKKLPATCRDALPGARGEQIHPDMAWARRLEWGRGGRGSEAKRFFFPEGGSPLELQALTPTPEGSPQGVGWLDRDVATP